MKETLPEQGDGVGGGAVSMRLPSFDAQMLGTGIALYMVDEVGWGGVGGTDTPAAFSTTAMWTSS